MRANKLPIASVSPRRGLSFFLTAYCLLFAIPATIACVIIDSVQINIGDFLGSPVLSSLSQELTALSIYLLAYLALLLYGRELMSRPWKSASPVARDSLVYVICIGCFLVDLFFYFAFGFGRAGAETSTSLSVFSTLMPKDISLMLALYLNAKHPHRALAIMLGFTLFALSLGWTGQFFTLFITCLYFFRDWLRRRLWVVMFLVAMGVVVYPAIFSIKLGVRQGDEFDYNILSAVHLASRLTGYPCLIFLQDEYANFLASYQDYFAHFNYLVEPLLAIIPKSIFGVQANITLEKALVDYVGGNSDLTQFIWGLPTKFWFFWQVGLSHFILFCAENAAIFGFAYLACKRSRNEFMTFYIFLLLGLYVWNGDISTLFVSLLRTAVFFAFYQVLNAAFAQRRGTRPGSGHAGSNVGATERLAL
jgi:hypothetical protein